MVHVICFFFFKQKPAYEMRISDWSSDVCSSDLAAAIFAGASEKVRERRQFLERGKLVDHAIETALLIGFQAHDRADRDIEPHGDQGTERRKLVGLHGNERSEEHTSELQSLMRISYAVFCLKKKRLNEQYKKK